MEQLNAARIAGHAPDDATARWMADLDDVMHAKLAAVGLTSERDSATLGAFLDAYIASRHDAKPRTVVLFKQARGSLVGYFGENKPLRDITPGDADEWRLWLLKQGLAENTVRRRCGRAKQFLRHAMKKGLVQANPFTELKSTVLANREKYHFVSREDAARIIDACPDAQWRLLFALSRYDGLRCPSEHLGLRWCDVDWERERIKVRSPKTEHHPGGESREIPMFPELKPFLEDVWELAEPGTEFVVTRYRDDNANLRTQLLRIMDRAGVKAWPKLFQNLRSTRETELAETFPMHVVCAWIGNSQPVAAKHYLQLTDEHFAKAVRNPVQQPSAEPRTAPQPSRAAHEKPPELQGVAADCGGLLCTEVPPQGLEP